MPDWLTITRGDAPLVVAIPHSGTDLPSCSAPTSVSPWLARKDTDWWLEDVYSFAAELGATIVRTTVSRSIIDVNRDPSGQSLYPGQATTELCPTTTFDGEPLYAEGSAPAEQDIAARIATWFTPYHAALDAALDRLKREHGAVILYDAHSIRSRVPRLFDGELPALNLGTNGGATCASELRDTLARICADSGLSHVVDGRFRGGWTTRHYGVPDDGVHAVQMEIACRAYMNEPEVISPENWPSPCDAVRIDRLQMVLRRLLLSCIDFVEGRQ